MTMNKVVNGWKRQHVGSNQIGSEERDRVDIDKHGCTPCLCLLCAYGIVVIITYSSEYDGAGNMN